MSTTWIDIARKLGRSSPQEGPLSKITFILITSYSLMYSKGRQAALGETASG